MTDVLDGTALSRRIAATLKDRIERFGRSPKLLIVQVGNDPRSVVYINRKKAFGKKIGATVEHMHLESVSGQDELMAIVQKEAAREDIDGILIQSPLPEGISLSTACNAIGAKKDVDGLSAMSMQAMLERARAGHGSAAKGHVAATARGVESLLRDSGISLTGKRLLVIGRSLIVGLPTALGAIANDATVTVAHSASEDLMGLCKQADIVVLAIGSPRFYTKEYAHEKQIVIDVGITAEESGGIAGDADFAGLNGAVQAISPVPGGVGPMTVASLFENLCDAAGIPA